MGKRAMLQQIKISGYRGFKHYTMSDLTRVNLLVGENNCGKTSILECVEFLASGGDPWGFVKIAERRERISIDRDDQTELPSVDVAHCFHGHKISQGIMFSVKGDNGLVPVEISIDLFKPVVDHHNPFSAAQLLSPSSLGLMSKGTWFPGDDAPTWPITDGGRLDIDYGWAPDAVSPHRSNDQSPVAFILPESLDARALGTMWNGVLQSKRDSYVYEALRILEPDLEDIMIESGVLAGKFIRPGKVLVSLTGADERLPLSSFGDGLRHLLGLAVSLIESRKGILLIDEIDTGLHYSIMADMWKLVIQTAIKEDIQVFATTHSYDCIQGLAEVCRKEPDLQGEVAVHKITSDLEMSIPFHGRELPIVSKQDIEVR